MKSQRCGVSVVWEHLCSSRCLPSWYALAHQVDWKGCLYLWEWWMVSFQVGRIEACKQKQVMFGKVKRRRVEFCTFSEECCLVLFMLFHIIASCLSPLQIFSSFSVLWRGTYATLSLLYWKYIKWFGFFFQMESTLCMKDLSASWSRCVFAWNCFSGDYILFCIVNYCLTLLDMKVYSWILLI